MTTDVLPEAPPRDGTDGAGADTADRLALLEDLRALSPRQRAVLVLRYFDDLTEADTAAALGISVGTVKSHARDALARLRNQQSGEERSAAAAP
ncbi:MAG TPA: sigma-70 family RNA polymerase sigma factor [Nocardioides sp.]|nr:sigma-70 family RNA polymerase sigma factor [Nocardioides sp.]